MIIRMPTLSASSMASVALMVYRKYSNALVTAIAALILCRTAFAQGESPGPYISDNSFDAGSVRQGDLVEHVFMARNSGPSAVTVSIDALSHPGMKVRRRRNCCRERPVGSLLPGTHDWFRETRLQRRSCASTRRRRSSAFPQR